MPSDSRRVLVLGGTGHIGAAIARQLASDGFEVRASGRSPEPRANLAGVDVQQLAGDDSHTTNLEAWMQDCSLVVDAATPYPVWRHGARGSHVVAAARQRARTLIALAKERRAALIHISSFTTLPATGSIQDKLRLATVRGMHPYFEVKETVEREMLNALRTGMKGCVINPAACFGPYDLKPADQGFVPMLLRGKVAGTLNHPVNVIDVRDVASYLSAIVQQDLPFPQVAVLGHNLSIDALTRQICALAGVPAPTFRAPLLLSLAGAYWAESAAALAGRRTPWPSLPILLTAAGRNMALSKEQIALGIRPRPLEQTLIDAIDWYRQIGRC